MLEQLEECKICPHNCKINRIQGQKRKRSNDTTTGRHFLETARKEST